MSAALRAAFHAALRADAALIAALGGARIHDAVPDDAALPYVVLGDSEYDDAAREFRLVVQAWSRHGGHAEAHAIAAALLQALDAASLGDVSAAVADLRRGGDGATYHTVVRFCAMIDSSG